MSKQAKNVKVAILDSGLDLPEEIKYAYEDRITYRSWLNENVLEEVDTDGHGTHATGLILQVAPNADVYVARVTKGNSGRERFDAKIIAEVVHKPLIVLLIKLTYTQAICWAVDEWDVDIITMSFGFDDLVGVIHEAVLYAAKRNKIIFAAASNTGNRHGIAWPARSPQVICIHATDGDGDHSSFTPTSREQDFATVGQAVKSYWPPHLCEGDQVLRSGTSSAAPVAAGIAAIVLEYARPRLSEYARSESLEAELHIIDTLNSNTGMRAVFRLMLDVRGGYNCIVPWKLLDKRARESTICDKILEELRNNT